MLLTIVRPGLSQSVHRSETLTALTLSAPLARSAPIIDPVALADTGAFPHVARREPQPFGRVARGAFFRADTIIKRNRGLGAVIGGGVGLAIGGVIGYHRGDSRVPFDQLAGAAIYGGIAGLTGAIIGATFGPRVP